MSCQDEEGGLRLYVAVCRYLFLPNNRPSPFPASFFFIFVATLFG